jgi:type IV secretion system protein VirB11
MSIAALETYLGPLKNLFDAEGISEISINRPGEAWVEKRGDMERVEVPTMNLEHLMSLARLVAQSTSQTISEEAPLLSATLPAGYRIQVVFPPACVAGNVVMSIRKQTIMDMDLPAYQKLGAFDSTSIKDKVDELNEVLKKLLEERNIIEFLRAAVKGKKNILISGGTSTGKTTFINAMLKEIPMHERMITIEDAREVILNQPNQANLLVSKGGQGRAKVNTQDLIEASLRLRPDRIIVGELRGAEAFSFLRAVNTGHPGSIATLHADSPALAIDQLTMMVMQAGIGLTRDEIRNYIDGVVEVIIQLKRAEKGRRYVSEIKFTPLD